jgi:hypothetical protein
LPIAEAYEDMNKHEQARFDGRIDLLEKLGPELFKADWCGPLGKGIWKLKIKGGGPVRQHRFMLCRGPVDKNSEVTLLMPAFEKDGKLEPADALEQALQRGEEVASNPHERRTPWTKT